MADAPDFPLTAFLDAFRKDVAAGTVRALAEYLARFPGDDVGIAASFASDMTALRESDVEDHGAKSDTRTTPRSQSPSESDVGRLIGPYRVVRELGRGGQGVVFLAEDTRLPRRVALKVLTSAVGASREDLARFDREAAVASKVDHPGVCAVYETGMSEGAPYIAMRLAEGETLGRRIKTTKAATSKGASTAISLPEVRNAGARTGTQPPPARAAVIRVVRFIEDVALVLHAAHMAGIIHRDVKPGNIMVGSNGQPTILDFGLARDLQSDLPTMTQAGDFFGTPAYMSPEQLLANRVKLDARTDVFSLGVTLYECLTLGRPFEHPSREGLVYAIQYRDPGDPRRLNPAITGDLKIVIEMALEKSREKRYLTALDFAEDLRRVREHEPIAAKPVGKMTRLWRWCQRNPALATAVCGLFVVLSVGLSTSLHYLGVSETALAEKTTALGEKAVALSEKTVALADYDRLGDVSRLQQLSREAEQLWPATPERLGDLKSWLIRATALEGSLAGHREVIAKLRASPTLAAYTDQDRAADLADHAAEQAQYAALAEERTKVAATLVAAESRAASRTASRNATDSAPEPLPAGDSPEKIRTALTKLDGDLRALEAKVHERLTWRFSDRALQFKHDTLTKLLTDLTAFVDPDPTRGTFANVKQRRAFAESVRHETLERYDAKWKEAIASIADRAQCPKYDGLTVVPHLGLIPIGKDPSSGLWEFAHLQTTAPGVDPVPERRTNGRLVFKETTGLVFVLIPGGTFNMGAVNPDDDHRAGEPNVDAGAADNEGPVQAVSLAPYFLSKYEMTQGQWLRVVGKNPSQYSPAPNVGGKPVDLRNPVEQVSYEDCSGPTGALTRLGLLLPTEAQWEYAARAGTTTPWWSGEQKETLAKSANVADAFAKRAVAQWTCEKWSDGYTVHAPVGSFAPNGFGLHDTAGNVFEWCRDWYGGYDEPVTPGDGLRKVPASRYRVLRGGSFDRDASYARAAYRNNYTPDYRNNVLGVRPAKACRQN